MAWGGKGEVKIGILTPSRGMVDIRWAAAYSQIIAELAKRPVHQYIEVGYAVDEARNNGVESALKDGCTHILFLDDDIYPSRYDMVTDKVTGFPRYFERLLWHAYPLVSGLYWSKKGGWASYVIEGENTENAKCEMVKGTLRDFAGRKMFVDAVGGGFFMAEARVFEKVPYPWFQFKREGRNGEKKRTMGEDIFFGVQARRAGFRFLVDTSLIGMHGQQIFRVEGNKVADQPFS